jgi:hypothetical protein
MKHYTRMSENDPGEDDGAPYTGENVIYREKGVSGLDVQRAADTLLRLGRKPSIAALREQLGGGSPNTLGPLLEQYWKSLGTRLPAGPEALERVPESLARLTEALWLRSLDEARERARRSLIGASPAQREAAALQGKVTELTAALAESRARSSELETQLMASLRDRLELRELVRQLTSLLKSEQELRAQDRSSLEARSRDIQASRDEALAVAKRRLAPRVEGPRVTNYRKAAEKSNSGKRSAVGRAVPAGGQQKRGRPAASRRVRSKVSAQRSAGRLRQ